MRFELRIEKHLDQDSLNRSKIPYRIIDYNRKVLINLCAADQLPYMNNVYYDQITKYESIIQYEI